MCNKTPRHSEAATTRRGKTGRLHAQAAAHVLNRTSRTRPSTVPDRRSRGWFRGNTEGIGVVEAYDLDAGGDSTLANIATRGSVETGDNILIGGFILRGNSASVLVRAIGPELTGNGVPNALQDPTLELRDVNGAVLMANDNWKESQEAEIAAIGIAPTDNRKSAILKSLPGGTYTAIVRGKSDSVRIGLVEVYRLGVP